MWVALGHRPMKLAEDRKMLFCAHVLKHSCLVQRRSLPSVANSKEGFSLMPDRLFMNFPAQDQSRQGTMNKKEF